MIDIAPRREGPRAIRSGIAESGAFTFKAHVHRLVVWLTVNDRRKRTVFQMRQIDVPIRLGNPFQFDQLFNDRAR